MMRTKNKQQNQTQEQQAVTRRQIVRLLLLSSLPASVSGVVGLYCGLYGAGCSSHDHGYTADQAMLNGDAVVDREGGL